MNSSVTRWGKFAIFIYISSFKTRFVVLILTLKSSLMQLFSIFNLSLFNLDTVWATFSKNYDFFKLMVTLIKSAKTPSITAQRIMIFSTMAALFNKSKCSTGYHNSAIILSVVTLNVIMLNVVMPQKKFFSSKF